MILVKFLKGLKFSKFLLVFFIYSGIGAAIAAFILDHYWNNNQTPVPIMIHSDLTGVPPKKVKFDGANSSDPDGDELKFSWCINGVEISSNPQFEYIFRNVGNYNITLNVEDTAGHVAKKSVFVNIDPPKTASSIKEALTHFEYKVGWNSSIRNEIKYHPIDVIKFINKHTVMLYDFNGISEIHAILLEHNRKIFGIWKDSENVGELSMTFNKDYTEASGWWSYDNGAEKYSIKLKRLNTKD